MSMYPQTKKELPTLSYYRQTDKKTDATGW